MSKRVFWPVTLILMGLIFMASNLGYLPVRFWNLWPIILIIVGLGGLLTSDRDEWFVDQKTRSRKTATRRSTKRSAKRTTKKTGRRASKRKTTRK